MDTERSSVGISSADQSIPMDVPIDIPKRETSEQEPMLHEEELKLDNISDNLEHADFSKLLELDEKSDDDLFRGINILDQHIKNEHNKQDTELEQQEQPTSDESKNGLLEKDHDQDNSQDDRQDGDQNEDQDEEQESDLNGSRGEDLDHDQEEIQSPKSLAVFKEMEIPVSKPSTQIKHEENTPAAIIQERFAHNAQRHNSLTPMMFPLKQLNELKSDIQNLKLKSENSDEELNAPQLTQVHPQLLQSNDSNTPTQSADLSSADEQSKISAYARLDFQDFTFYVQTLQVIIGRRSENDFSHKVDVNLGPSKSISRRHAQIFYNFGTGRFELSIMGKNGAFVDDNFVERGSTVPLKNKTKIQIGQIPFQFVLPDQDGIISKDVSTKNKSSPIKPTQQLKKKVKKEKEVKEKEKKQPKPPKPPKKVYTLQEIPPEYRTKPTCSYSNLITSCLRKFSTEKGMSLSEIYSGIRDLFPYYKYCPDGWQSSVRHNLSLNKSFCKVSKEGKGWLWGLDEAYIAERERQKKKQAEAQAAKAKAAEIKQQQQQEQRLKKQQQQQNATSKQPNMAQTLAANRPDKKSSSMDDNQRTMKYLQEQLMILTKDRKGLDKSLMAQILTQALAMTINQVTQAAKAKGISGNPLTALIDKNPEHLNLILAAAVNAATVKVTNGKVKQLVSMPPPTAKIQPTVVKKEVPLKKVSMPKPPTPSIVKPSNSNTLNRDQPFDPTSLSKFFQPKQQAGARPVTAAGKTPTPPPPLVVAKPITSTVLPQKRTVSETESSDSEGSNSSDSGEENRNEDSSDASSTDSSSSEDSDGGSGSDSDSDGSNSDSNSDASDENEGNNTG